MIGCMTVSFSRRTALHGISYRKKFLPVLLSWTTVPASPLPLKKAVWKSDTLIMPQLIYVLRILIKHKALGHDRKLHGQWTTEWTERRTMESRQKARRAATLLLCCPSGEDNTVVTLQEQADMNLFNRTVFTFEVNVCLCKLNTHR